MMRIIEQFSPNHDTRAEGASVDMLVLHYTGMRTGAEALARMCDPAAQVSAHYMVEEDGRIFHLVPEALRAWHAGKSYWRGREALNQYSIGIEIVNPGHEWGYRPFPEAQMQAVVALCQGICQRHAIAPCDVLAHSDIAPDRKEDPGELFDWERLAKAGVGLWPQGERAKMDVPLLAMGMDDDEVERLQLRLLAFGYNVPVTGIYDDALARVVLAFKRHYCPKHLNAIWDEEAEWCLGVLGG